MLSVFIFLVSDYLTVLHACFLKSLQNYFSNKFFLYISILQKINVLLYISRIVQHVQSIQSLLQYVNTVVINQHYA